jgi:lauroyl/myristoyl acyltransferase
MERGGRSAFCLSDILSDISELAGQPVATPNARSAQADRLPLLTVNDLLWFLYLYPFRLLSILVPRPVLYWVAGIAELLIQFRWRRRREKAIPWIVSVCGCMPGEAVRIARQSISNDMSRQLDDLVLLRASHRQMLHCTGIEGIQHVDQAMAAGNGVILLAAHFCVTRIAVRYLATLGYPVLSVQKQSSRKPSEGRLGHMLRQHYVELRRQANPDVVDIQDAECSLKILRRLRGGGLVHMHVDALSATTAVEGPFLGVPWRFPAGAFDFVRLSGCAVVPMLCLGRSTGFRIRFSPMLRAVKAASREEFVNSNLPAFTEVFERQIADHPEEWRLWLWR